MSTSADSLVSARCAALSGLLLWLLSSNAPAVPLHYDESVSGDLPPWPTNPFVLDIGANTISGDMYFFVLEPGCPHFCSDFDGFAFVLPERVQLMEVSLAFVIVADNVSRAEAVYRLCTGLQGSDVSCTANALGEQTVSFLDPSPAAVDFDGAIPLESAGVYTVETDSLGIGPIDPTLPEGWSVDYTWTFRVEAIPDPASLPLMVTALLMMPICIAWFSPN